MRRRGLVIAALGVAALLLVTACQPTKKKPPPPPQLNFSPVPNPGAPPTLTWETFVPGLARPWDLGFTPDGTMLFTERVGRISARLGSGAINLLATPPDVQQGSEGGMLGLAVDPDFSSNRFVYTCFTSNLPPGAANDVRLVRWTVDAGYTTLTNRVDIVTGMPYSTGRHSGCRPRFQPGTDPPQLYVGTGDSATNGTPQDVNSLGGKVLRVTRDGGPVSGNMSGRVFSLGHRNVQGIAFQPGTRSGMSTEHGPGVDDEVNLIVAGDFGWHPNQAACGGSYCENVPMTNPGAIEAVWSSGDVTPAPSGASFLAGPQWEGWDGALAVCMLGGPVPGENELRIMFPNSQGTITQTVSAVPFGNTRIRLRSAVQGPDGNLYVATDVDSPNGQILRVIPS
jgi:aldose sugar dehydrogenase